jgi:hypothetical protein
MRMVKRQTKQKYHKVGNVLTIETLLQLNTISLKPIRMHCFHLMTEKNTLDYTNIIIFQHIFEFFRSLLFYWGVWNANGRAEVPSM